MLDITWDAQGKPWLIINPVLCHRTMRAKDAKGKAILADCSYTAVSVRPATPEEVDEWKWGTTQEKNDGHMV